MSLKKYSLDLIENKNFHFAIALLVLIILTLLIINFFNIKYPIEVTNRQASGELAVIGEGKVDIVPDVATADLGIVANNASTVEAAQQELNRVNNSIVAALEKLNIKKEDIKTSNYSIYPSYDYQINPAGQIVGYSGNVTVSVKVRDTSKLPDVLQAATLAGANQITGTSYSVDNPEKYREEARDKAIQNAKEQAQKLASELGIKLGKVVNFVESTNDLGGPIPMYERAYGMGGDAGGIADLQPGSQTITSTVTLYFEKR